MTHLFFVSCHCPGLRFLKSIQFPKGVWFWWMFVWVEQLTLTLNLMHWHVKKTFRISQAIKLPSFTEIYNFSIGKVSLALFSIIFRNKVKSRLNNQLVCVRNLKFDIFKSNLLTIFPLHPSAPTGPYICYNI